MLCEPLVVVFVFTRASRPLLLKSSILPTNKSLRIFNITKMAAKRSQCAMHNGQYRVFKTYPYFKAKVQKAYPIHDQNQLKSIPYLWPNQLKNHTLWGRTYLYSPYNGVCTPQGAYQNLWHSPESYVKDKNYHPTINKIMVVLHGYKVQSTESLGHIF